MHTMPPSPPYEQCLRCHGTGQVVKEGIVKELTATAECEILLNHIQDAFGCMRVALSKANTPQHELGRIEYNNECADLKVLADALRRNVNKAFDPII